MNEILEVSDLSDNSKIIINNDQLINIVNNPSFNWKYKTYDISNSRVKCKYFPDTNTDYILNFTNSQRNSVLDRIKNNLFLFMGNDNPVTLTFIISDKGIKYGKINDGLEFGSSHLHLIENSEEKTIIGGELSIDFLTNLVEYNLLSGTFSLKIMDEIEKEHGLDVKNSYEKKIKLLVEKAFKIKQNSSNPDLVVRNVDNILLPNNKPNMKELRNICKLNSLELINGIITSDITKRCKLNSLTRIEDIDIRNNYIKIKDDLLNKKVSFTNTNLTCHQYIDQEPIDKILKDLIKDNIENISSAEYNLEINIYNTIAVLKNFIPKFWISSPISRAISTGYFYSIISDYNPEFISIIDLWREIDSDFGMIVQPRGGKALKMKSGVGGHYKWCNFKDGSGVIGKIRKNIPKQMKKLDIFKKYYIDTIPDLSSNIIWLTGHGSTSKLFCQMFCKNRIEISDGALNIYPIKSLKHLQFGETIIINQYNCYVLKEITDIEYIKDRIEKGKILILTRHLQPEISEYSKYWRNGQDKNINFGNLNLQKWPGRPIYPDVINISNIVDNDEISQWSQPLTISVLYGSSNVNISGF